MISSILRRFFRETSSFALILGVAALLTATTGTLYAAPTAANTSTVRYLSGTGPENAVEWEFLCTAGRGSGDWTKIRVPSCWEQEGFGTYYYGVWRRGKPLDDPQIPREQGKYRTRFEVPASWKDQNVRIVFEGVMTDADVLINGKSAGPVHQGGFYRFEYEIASLLDFVPGAVNTLEVTVSKESANDSVNRAERRGDYWTFGGIYRPVWIEARPANYIDRVAIDAKADGTFTMDIFRGGKNPPGGVVTAQIYDSQDHPVGGPFSSRFAADGTSATVQTRILAPLQWTAETPNLYRVEISYAPDRNGNVVHTYSQRFGFRTIEVRPRDGIYVNGQKITLKGVNRHCFNPETGRSISQAQSYADVQLIKEMNMNAVRMSHYQPDIHFLEACDELGLYVIDELAGWQGSYDTPTGARLIGQLVRRDVNHPCILFWDNGNEGGWNTENDGEFAKWDPQYRAVLHPWELHDNIQTKHYPKYDTLAPLCAGPDIYLPTEFLHGLYDGGQGAGFRDFWNMMRASPTVAGGFFWVFADEGVARADQFGRIDNAGNNAPDGIVGPHGEREGSFYTIREIWSPVIITAPLTEKGELPVDWDGILQVENAYDFTGLDRCVFEWQVDNVPRSPAARFEIVPTDVVQIKQTAFALALPPHSKAAVKLALSAPLPTNSVVRIVAKDNDGREFMSWTFPTARTPDAGVARAATSQPKGDVPVFNYEGQQVSVVRGPLALQFSNTTGELLGAQLNGKPFPLTEGPRLTGYIRDQRRFTNLFPPVSENRPGSKAVATITPRTEKDGTLVIDVVSTLPENDSAAGMRRLTWTIPVGSGDIRLDYEYKFDGEVDLLGVQFLLLEKDVISKQWYGRGPYRVYRNRLEGGVLGTHDLAYNDSIPGQTYAYPEFKGYFRDWRWLSLETTAGHITVTNNADNSATGAPYLGLFRPRDGVPMMMEFPDTGLTILDVIPAQGSKFDLPDRLGPQSATPKISGLKRGSISFGFGRK